FEGRGCKRKILERLHSTLHILTICVHTQPDKHTHKRTHTHTHTHIPPLCSSNTHPELTHIAAHVAFETQECRLSAVSRVIKPCYLHTHTHTQTPTHAHTHTHTRTHRERGGMTL